MLTRKYFSTAHQAMNEAIVIQLIKYQIEEAAGRSDYL